MARSGMDRILFARPWLGEFFDFIGVDGISTTEHYSPVVWRPVSGTVKSTVSWGLKCVVVALHNNISELPGREA